MEITEEQVTALMKQLDVESQEILAKLMLKISPDRAIIMIKKWIDCYEADDPIDLMIANTCAEIISKFGTRIIDASKEAQKSELPMRGRDAFAICINVMQEITEKMKLKQAEYENIKH